jgi:TetR/AcrR family transcriptional regulator, transcriptional repressor of aconitase
MQAPRLSRDSRRQQILDCALPLFAQHGFARTTTRSVADAAGISEALLFKHFPTKSAVYAAILADICEADPGLVRLRALPPSTGTLVIFVRGIVNWFLSRANPSCNRAPNEKLRLTLYSHLEDGEFAQILFEKVEQLVVPIFIDSLTQAIAAGDAKSSKASPRDLFWFLHHTLCMLAATLLPRVPPLAYPPAAQLERQVCEYILRGIGLTDAAIAAHADCAMPGELTDVSLESA